MEPTGPVEEPLDQEISEGRPAALISRMGLLLRGLAVDHGPFRASRDYKLLWWGELISEAGHQITHVAVYFQVFALTGSAAKVGLVGLVQFVPLVLASILGGPLVDRIDRRKLLLVTQCAFAATSGVLLYGALLGDPPLVLIYGTVAASAALGGIASPTRSAIVPNLVPREMLPAAVALNQVMWNTAMIAGPAVGGVIIAKLGLTWAYAIDAVTYGATIGVALMIAPQPPRREPGEIRPAGLVAIAEAFAYLKGRRVLQSTFTVDLVAMIFGMPRALFPILAVVRFHGGPEVVGALFSALAVGALAGAVTAGWVGRVRRQGPAVLIAVAIWGVGIVGFGLSGSALWLALLLLAVAGAADVISAVFRSTILQSTVPDSLRGRLSSVHILVVAGGPRLGDLEAGLVAQAFTPAVSVVSGGVACIAGVALIALLVPEFVRYRVDVP